MFLTWVVDVKFFFLIKKISVSWIFSLLMAFLTCIDFLDWKFRWTGTKCKLNTLKLLCAWFNNEKTGFTFPWNFKLIVQLLLYCKKERLFIKLCNCYLSIYLFLLNSELKLKVFFHTCLAWSTVYCVKTQNSKKLFGCLVTYGRNCIDQSQHWNHLFGSMVFWGCPVSSGSITLGSCVLWAYSDACSSHLVRMPCALPCSWAVFMVCIICFRRQLPLGSAVAIGEEMSTG